MKKRVFSGIRPSGQLHLGNYLGAIKNWIELQNSYDCIYAVVDYHAITTPFQPKELKANTREVILDYLAAGLEPKKCSLVIQSMIPEHTELAWIFASLTPLSWFERVPTYKEKAEQHANELTLGLLSYPALMAADILAYKAEAVPVGADQLPHIELTNKIGQRFNHKYGQIFPEVKAIIHKEGARIMSLKDPSKKMSKTGDESIGLTDKPEVIRKKIKRAVTDSGTGIKSGPNKPALTNLLTIFALVTNKTLNEIEKEYQGQNYAAFKADLSEAVITFLQPFQKRRQEIAKDKKYVDKILTEGTKKAQAITIKTLAEVRKKLGVR